MPYYSIHIAGGDVCESEATSVKEALRGKASDYKAEQNFFYVQSHRKREDLEALVVGMVSDECEVSVRRILKSEYNWR